VKFNHLLAFLLTLIALLILTAGFVLEFLQIVIFSSDCYGYSVLMFQEDVNIDAEVGKGSLTKLIVINTGSYTDDYKVEIEGPKWLLIKPMSFTLKPEQSKNLFLYVSPDFDAEGKYEIIVTVNSKCVSESQIFDVSVF
jgi:hypothetical protein